ncbi:hypothetical protein TIFTF001_031980 [Ficus carica]|uniref:Uncharacterized protein n=1 Tax=Ficus carica TaxID=3494 RepID=A0AA88J5X4_FICCA|nr:hypothetical protein TIFTF001_031980 [Ficus carica]
MSLCICQVNHPFSVKERTYKVLHNIAIEISSTMRCKFCPIDSHQRLATPLSWITVSLAHASRVMPHELHKDFIDIANLPDEFLRISAPVWLSEMQSLF